MTDNLLTTNILSMRLRDRRDERVRSKRARGARGVERVYEGNIVRFNARATVHTQRCYRTRAAGACRYKLQMKWALRKRVCETCTVTNQLVAARKNGRATICAHRIEQRLSLTGRKLDAHAPLRIHAHSPSTRTADEHDVLGILRASTHHGRGRTSRKTFREFSCARRRVVTIGCAHHVHGRKCRSGPAQERLDTRIGRVALIKKKLRGDFRKLRVEVLCP